MSFVSPHLKVGQRAGVAHPQRRVCGSARPDKGRGVDRQHRHVGRDARRAPNVWAWPVRKQRMPEHERARRPLDGHCLRF